MNQTTKSSRLNLNWSTTLGGAALLLAIAQLASRALGVLRDRLLATGFGAGPELDVYYAAFRVPDFLFNILILGAISAAFIPVFAGYLANRQRAEADRIASVILSVGMTLLAAVALLVFVFAAEVMRLVAPGFTESQYEQVTLLTRIMLLSPIFFGLSGIFGSMLNSYHKFIAYAAAPLCYNLGIIAGALVAPQYGLHWLAIGVVAGAALQMLIQGVAIARVGFRFRPSFDLSHPGVRRILILMLPATAGVSVIQINQLVETMIATTLQEGSLSQFWLATSLSMLPVGVIGASYATAAFPRLAAAASRRQEALFTSELIRVIRGILFLIIPASIAMMFLRAQIVRLVYGAGKFSFEDTRFVTSLLGILAVSLFAQALIPLLTRAFYSLRNTKTPVLISAAAMILNIVLALGLSYYLGVVGLAIAFSVASIIQLALLFFFLSAKVPAIENPAMLSAITKIVVASLAMGTVIYGTLYGVDLLLHDLVRSQTVLFFLIQAGAASLLGAAAYLGAARALGLAEATALLRRLRLAKPRA